MTASTELHPAAPDNGVTRDGQQDMRNEGTA